MNRRRNTRRWLFDWLEDRTLLSFSAAHIFPTGDYPVSVAVGDLNGDGKPDLVTANVDSSDVSVFLGNGDGTFQTAGYDFDTDPYSYSYPSPRSVAVGDFNDDGKPDLVTAVFYGGHGLFYGEVNVLLGNGQTAGNYRIDADSTNSSNASVVAVGDFNSDGQPDLVTANAGRNDVSVLLGNGNGTFQTAVNYDVHGYGDSYPYPYFVGSSPASVAVGDFNGDGKPDLVTANVDGNDVSVLLGNGDGTFQAPVNYAAGTGSDSVAVGDFNGDGKPDLITANGNDENVSVLVGNGDGTFQAAVNYDVHGYPNSVAVGDFNGDGQPDLVTANGNDVSVLLGNGNGTFQDPVNYDVHGYPNSVAVGDFNGDGKPDIATADGNPNPATWSLYGNDVSVLTNTWINTSTTVTASEPSSVYGQSVTFTATINAATLDKGTATGSVQFQVDGLDLGSTIALVNGIASLDIATIPAGLHSITARYLGNSDFSPSQTTAAVPLTVTPAPLTVTVNNASRAYGDPNPNFTGTIIGIKNNDNITATYTTDATPASAVGNYAITATLSDPDNKLGNYTISNPGATLTVTARLVPDNPVVPLPLQVTPYLRDAIFASALYHNILGHEPSPASLNFWVNHLLAGASAGQMATTLWNSAEHRTLVRRHQATALSYNSALSLALQEFQPTSMRHQDKVFVTTFSRDVLGHNPTPAALNSLVRRMLVGNSQNRVATAIWNSVAHRTRVKRHRAPQISYGSALADASHVASNA